MSLLALGALLGALFALGYTFVGYPLLIAALARLRPRPLKQRDWQPRVSVCIAMHNGLHELDRKLDGLLGHDYPAELLDIVVVSDGSDDGSAELLQRRAGGRITAIIEPQRRGKSAALGRAIDAAQGEVLVFTDMRQRLAPGAIRALCAALATGDLKVVSGLLQFEPAAGGEAASVGAYWRFESWLRRAEARSGSVVGVSGALYALRRADMPPLPAALVLDDVWVPMQVAARGGRVGIEPSAIAWDIPAPSLAVESARKRRTLAGNWQLIARWPQLLLPGAHPLWWRFVSHKLLRLLMPFALLTALLANAALWSAGPLWQALLLLQLAGYALGLAALRLPTLRALAPLKLVAAFLELNLYALLGLWDFLRGRQAHLWRTTQLEAAAVEPVR